MDPFSILCKSCAARLKVTESSSVGQILACPKCGTMIEVVPPEGWVAPEPDARPSSSSGEFEDIDQILADPGQVDAPRSAKSKTTSLPTTRPTKRPTGNSQPSSTPQQPVAAPVMDQPVLPTNQWTSEQTRQRKRMVTTVSVVLGGLLLGGVILAATLYNVSKPVVEVAEKSNSVDPVAVPETDPENVDPDIPGKLSDEPPPDGDPLQDSPLTTEEPSPAVLGSSTPPLDAGDAPPVSTDIETDTAEVVQPVADDQTTSPPATTQSPFSSSSPLEDGPLSVDPGKQDRPADVGMVEAFEDDLGDLASLLEQGGTSMLEIKDLTAAIRTPHSVGLPKYIISKPDPMKFDLEKQIELPIGGLKYDAVPLTQITRNLFAITGIPITIDSRSILAAGKDPNPLVSIKISDTDLNDALNQLLEPLAVDHVVHSTGVTIGVFNSQEMSNATFSLPGIPDIDQPEKERFLAVIQMLIEPESWARQENPATIELLGDQVVVRCSETVQHQVGNLLAKLQASLSLVDNPDHAHATAITTSRWHSLETKLAKNPGLSHSVQTDIGSFLTKIHTNTGVTVLVDWEHIVAEGWTPLTMVPGDIREDTVEDAITELARGMNLTLVATDRNTLMLTSLRHPAQTVDLEVYPVSKLLAGKLNEKQLNRLVTEALGAQLQSENVRFMFESNCQCLIVSAPQTLQRQIEALLNRLGGI